MFIAPQPLSSLRSSDGRTKRLKVSATVISVRPNCEVGCRACCAINMALLTELLRAKPVRAKEILPKKKKLMVCFTEDTENTPKNQVRILTKLDGRTRM